MSLNIPSGGIEGAPNVPSFQVASGCWRASEIARRYAGISAGLQFPSFVTDPNFASVTMLCHFDTLGALVNTASGGTLGYFGGGCPLAPGKFGPVGAYCNLSNGASAQVQAASNAGNTMGSGDFTLEFFMYPFASITANVLDFRNAANSVCPLIDTVSDGSILYFVSGATRITGGAGTMTNNAWNHVAYCRSGSSGKLFANGTQTGSTYSDSNNYVGTDFALGNSNTLHSLGVAGGNAIYAELRITKGFARYTGNFTPPTARFPDR